MSHFFLKRPIFAVVISIFIMILGAFSLKNLPVEQFPRLSPVDILVTTDFPGASAETMAECVAAPLESAINGTPNMIYMNSQCTSPGHLKSIVTFALGTDPTTALITTQNRVNLALSALPDEVQKQGVVVVNSYPSVLLFIALQSQGVHYDDIFLSNFANIDVANHLNRIDGVTSAIVLNAKDYSMRIWLNTDKLAQYNLAVSDVTGAIREQNGIRAIGLIGQEPTAHPNQLTIPVGAKGRLQDPAQFENIILRATREGAIVYLKDVARVELGSRSYNINGQLNSEGGAFIAIYQDPSSNAIDVSNKVKGRLKELSQVFPEGISYAIPYDTTDYIRVSIKKVVQTLIEAAIFVAIILLIFLHSVRSALVPIAAMIVSIMGTFIGMHLLGFSINTLSLFGLVLSVGIVVDDAIVVVENIERNMRQNKLGTLQAAMKGMEEVAGPVIATSCVLAAVFIPVSFIGGIPGQFFKQFAITIALSVAISGFVALSLSPVLCVMLLKPTETVGKFASLVDRSLESITNFYVKWAAWMIERPKFALSSFILLLALTAMIFRSVPMAFVPHEDQGVLLISSTLPDGASLSRVEAVSKKVEEISLKIEGVEDILSFSGYGLIQSIPKIERASHFVKLKNWDLRKAKGESSFDIAHKLNEKFQDISESSVVALSPPDIPGIGVIGGFEFWVVNQGNADYSTLQKAVEEIVRRAESRKEYAGLIHSIAANGMELYIDVDTAKARSFGVRVDAIYEALQVLLGSLFVNQFTKTNHTYQVVVQAEPAFRSSVEDIGNVYVKSDQNEMIPLKSLVIPRFSKGPALYQKFNGFPAGLISLVPKSSDTGKVMSVIEDIAKEVLPPRMAYYWGGLAFQEKEHGGTSPLAPLGSLLFAFLVLAALYERWNLPIAILLGVPFAVFGAVLAVWLSGRAADIFFIIGIIALIGLSAKNSILIVEFARARHDEGMGLREAALDAAKLRFRAILMTSIATIVGALPLVMTSGSGAASRESVGTGVIGGMVMATSLALFFIPIFYKIMEQLRSRMKRAP
jgi:hydrophobe/amphiphile efflux-1 (HAE1) family protein